MDLNVVKRSFDSLKNYIEEEQFKGYDPFDGLNSKIFQLTPLKNNAFFRLAWLQLFKRNPINLRKVFLVPKEHNPKGLGLLLTGYCNLYKIRNKPEYLETIHFLSKKIIELKTNGYHGACWGYNFDWQAKAFFQPKYTPTIVATTFIGYGLLDAFDILKDQVLIDTANSSCEFILNDLNRTFDKEGDFAFSYSPLDHTQIFNASLLGARLLSRVYHYTKNQNLIDNAYQTVKYCMKHQNKDGSWSYGTLPHHQWIDNFHTGYNLECLGEFIKYSNDQSFTENLNLGLNYYLKTFFTPDGISKYYNNKTYPIDIHSPAQIIVALYRLRILKKHKPFVDKVINWTIQHMQDEKGYFYFRKDKYFKNKISYMRWAQSWMFYALSYYLKEMEDDQ